MIKPEDVIQLTDNDFKAIKIYEDIIDEFIKDNVKNYGMEYELKIVRRGHPIFKVWSKKAWDFIVEKYKDNGWLIKDARSDTYYYKIIVKTIKD